MRKDIFRELSHEHLLELAKGIRVAGAKEKELTERQQSVVATIRDLVVHIVEKKDIAKDYSLAESVGQLPKNAQVMIGVGDWLQVFNQQDSSSYFRPEDLSCELLQITGKNRLLRMTNFESLSSGWRLAGLSEDLMNEESITYDGRVKLLQNDLVRGKLFIKCLNTHMTSCSNSNGPVITGKKI